MEQPHEQGFLESLIADMKTQHPQETQPLLGTAGLDQESDPNSGLRKQSLET